MRENFKAIVIVSLIIIATVASIVKLQTTTLKSTKTVKSEKEVEFTHAKIIEVDSTQIKSITDAKSIYKTKESFILTDIVFQNSFSDLLSANKAIQKGKELHFYQDVTFKRRNGFQYFTNHAIYDQVDEKLIINERFKSIRQEDTFLGKSMVYYAKRDYVDAKQVDSILSLEEKK